MNYSYDLCGILVGIQTTYDQPRFQAVKDAAVNGSNKVQFFDMLPCWDFWEDLAGVIQAISPIWMKLGQIKGPTQ